MGFTFLSWFVFCGNIDGKVWMTTDGMTMLHMELFLLVRSSEKTDLTGN